MVAPMPPELIATHFRVLVETPEGVVPPTDEDVAEQLLVNLPDGCSVAVQESRYLRVEGRLGPTGAWHYVEIGKNGEVTATSENYSSKDACKEQGTIKAHELGVPFVFEEQPGAEGVSP
jgi:hypothetical protein